MAKSSNPIFTDARFLNPEYVQVRDSMTVSGSMNKTGLLFVILLVGALWTWSDTGWGGTPVLGWRVFVGVIGGLVLALVTFYKPMIAKYTAPAYAFLQGMALGGISAFFEGRYPGIVLTAVLLTFGVFATMWFVYASGIIKVTNSLRRGIFAATGGIFFVYVLNFILSFFGIQFPFIHSSGPVGIVISLVIVGIAAFNLLLDFDFIKQMSERNAPKTMEWFGAFGLMVTLVWLYFEILRLLAKTRK